MLDFTIDNVVSEIGFYYSEKNRCYLNLSETEYNINYNNTIKEIESLKIHNVSIEKDTIKIILERPGLLIGRKGENIDSLKNSLSKTFKMDIKIAIEEENLLKNLIPINFYSFKYSF